MKKYLPVIAIILSIVVVATSLQIIFVSKKSANNGQVKGASDSKIALNKLPNIPLDSNVPIKKQDIDDPYVYMNNGVLIDMDSFYPLWEQNAHDQVPIASTTKVMTAIVALENYNLNDVVTVSQDSAYKEGSGMGLMPQEEITIESLLKGLLITSGNDGAYALAEKMGVNNFVDKMNQKAKELNLKNTLFKDPAGLDDSAYSSAFDLAVMFAYALQKPKFTEIINTRFTTVYAADNYYKHDLDNSNRLINVDSPYYLSNSLGGKTGLTDGAGHCLVTGLKYNNHTLISVVLGTSEYTNEASAKESKKLLEWGINSFIWK